MTLTVKLTLIVTLILSIILPFGYYLIGEKNKKRYKKAIGVNIFFYFGAFVIAGIMMFGGSAQAADAATTAASTATGLGYIAAALVTGLACIGGGIAVAAAAPAAIGATSEDPKVFGKALIFVALGEGIALYGLLISILILNKVA
mgnify:FL=1